MNSEKVVTRFMGSETEYGVRSKSMAIARRYPPHVTHIGDFLVNGARMYPDVHGFAEYATPECDSIDLLIAHEFAGEQHVMSAYSKDEDVYSIHKRAISLGGKVHTGAHENYSTNLNVWSGERKAYLRSALATHLATRTPIIGAGVYKPEGYHIGQKISSFEDPEGTATTRKRALVNLRGEHHAGGGNLNRLHIISGDANMSPWQIRMKFATTSLVLRLLEHGVDIRDLFLDDPVKAAKIAGGKEDGMNIPLRLLRPKGEITHLTALDIQEELAKRAEALSQLVDLPEKKEIGEWLAIIQALKKYSTKKEVEPLMQQLDWFAKKRVLERGAEVRVNGERISPTDQIQRGSINDVRYDMLGSGVGVRLREPGRTFAPHMPDQKIVNFAITKPPRTGRAYLRGRLVHAIYTDPQLSEYRDTAGISWDGYSYRTVTRSLGPVERTYTRREVAERIDRLRTR